jgi:hypothetical protein
MLRHDDGGHWYIIERDLSYTQYAEIQCNRSSIFMHPTTNDRLCCGFVTQTRLRPRHTVPRATPYTALATILPPLDPCNSPPVSRKQTSRSK